jgi:hypothetical protein
MSDKYSDRDCDEPSMPEIKFPKASGFMGQNLTATQVTETNFPSKMKSKKQPKESQTQKSTISNKLEDHFKENFKKIVDNIVTQTQSRLGNVNDLQIEQENGVKEKMRNYFDGQNLHELKLKLFFNRWSGTFPSFNTTNSHTQGA